MTIATSTDIPNRVASCAVAHAPMPANVAWHSEICPAIPVITVIERKMTAKMVARIAMSSHCPLAWKKM